MPSFSERLKAQQKKLDEKKKSLDKLVNEIETAKESIKTVNKEIAEITDVIHGLEARILTEAISDKGISVEDIAAAIKAGLFDKAAPEKPPDTTDTSVEDSGATYSTNTEDSETKSDKEDLDDEISSSGETVGGA